MTVTTDSTRTYSLSDHVGRPGRWWLGGHLAVKAAAADTDGRFSQLEFTDPLGTAPPVHIHHREDETFYVAEGEVSFFVGDERIEATAGDYVFAPCDVPHTYLVRSEQARMLVTYAPAGIEQFFIEMGLPVLDERQPPVPVVPDHDTFARAMGAYGVDLIGPPPALDC
jgi:mannose-6-phosphate isomerase-like protein (cupin superfamily)